MTFHKERNMTGIVGRNNCVKLIKSGSPKEVIQGQSAPNLDAAYRKLCGVPLRMGSLLANLADLQQLQQLLHHLVLIDWGGQSRRLILHMQSPRERKITSKGVRKR